MDTAVSIVRAYLQANGYFTMTEVPVIEATGTVVRSATDLDVLAVRFPGERRTVANHGGQWDRDEVIPGTSTSALGEPGLHRLHHRGGEGGGPSSTPPPPSRTSSASPSPGSGPSRTTSWTGWSPTSATPARPARASPGSASSRSGLTSTTAMAARAYTVITHRQILTTLPACLAG
ncbi:MAG: hypothetical protein R3B49_00575 [Phycisphaerales bacterium]